MGTELNSAEKAIAPSTPLSRGYWLLLYQEHSAALFAFAFLVAVGVSKTLLTKLVFTHSPTPVAFSALSCIVTNICLTPILVYQGQFELVTRTFREIGRVLCGKVPFSEIKAHRSFAGICLAIALDLACQNVALAILSIALQQCIKATLPTFTVIVESIVRRKKFHRAIYVTVAAICIGPILVASGSSWKARSEAGSQAYGAVMMLVAMVGAAFKYVLCHKAIGEYKETMGVLCFTFWVETLVALMLLPWAIANGEASAMFAADYSASEWMLTLFTAAFGGVRIVAQFTFLAKTSATSLAMSSIAMQMLTILLGIFFFGDRITALLMLGVAFTILTSALYTWLKTSTILTAIDRMPKDPEKLTELKESRLNLATADSAQEQAAA